MTTANGQTPAPFMQDAPAVISTLGTDAHQGLTSEQAAHNLNQYGPNAFTKPKPESMLSRIVKTAADPMLIMLMIAAAITLGVNITRAMAGGHADILECVGIFFAIALSVTITVVMEGRSAKAFEALNDINDDTTVTVVRDGEVTLVSQRDITIGDVLQISTGDKLPADARLIESNDLTADESALTGESVPSAKAADAVFTDPKTPVADRTNMLYSGCFVTAGNGRAVVTAVGDDTEFGKIARELRAANTGMTPLQEKLAKLGKVIAVVGSIVAALVFVLQVARFVASGTASFDTISEAFITSITLIVAAVPEGLPTIVAACLAVNIIKMSKQNALVKKMVACETIGCINVICSDKTGTLTQNRMTVIEAYNAPGRALEKPEQIRNRMLLENFCVNGTADVTFPGATEAEAGAMPEFIGNPTECALLVAAHKAGLDYRIRRERATVLHTYPFSSETKSMTTVVRDGDGITVFAKGSPEKMLDLCAVDAKTRGEIEREIAKFQAQSCRVLGFAHRHISDKDADTAALDYAADRAGLESGMMFDGFVAIVDPLREDVPGAVERCRKAGIELKMLTGDNIVTATAIANELGILDERHIAVEARQIEEMSDEELSREIGRIRVIARSTPVIKMRVVNALKAQGNVVAVTGDGINDAPAIKNADVGIAMGIAGTEVSKEASDIVMLDDSFATIVTVAPLAHAVRFVHGDHCHVQAGEGFPKALELQPLWRDIEQIQLAGARQAHRFGEMLGRRGAGQRARCHAHFHEPVLLVLHQRDERRDHERQPRHADRRDLVAQRFSAACRQDRQRVAPAHQGGDDLPLAGTEGIVAKIFFQCLFWCHGRASFVSFPHYTTKSQRLQDVIQISLDSVARIP